MPKTTEEIVLSSCKIFNNKISIKPYNSKWYSEEELIKAIDDYGFCCNDNDCRLAKDMKKDLKQKLGLKR